MKKACSSNAAFALSDISCAEQADPPLPGAVYRSLWGKEFHDITPAVCPPTCCGMATRGFEHSVGAYSFGRFAFGDQALSTSPIDPSDPRMIHFDLCLARRSRPSSWFIHPPPCRDLHEVIGTSGSRFQCLTTTSFRERLGRSAAHGSQVGACLGAIQRPGSCKMRRGGGSTACVFVVWSDTGPSQNLPHCSHRAQPRRRRSLEFVARLLCQQQMQCVTSSTHKPMLTKVWPTAE